jgi:hypothetical protein
VNEDLDEGYAVLIQEKVDISERSSDSEIFNAKFGIQEMGELSKSSSSLKSDFIYDSKVMDGKSINSDVGAARNLDSDSESVAESSEHESTLEEGLIETEVEPILGEFQGYANDNVVLFYSVFFVLLLWVFYEETVVAKEYGIPMNDFVFYLYFQISIVPYQIVVDITQLNLTEWYHHLPMHDYLDYLNFRFINRKTFWKGNDPNYNTSIDPNLQSLDLMCYSSQHYFVQTIYVSGVAQVILGMQTLLWVKDYSCYAD